MQKPKVNWKRVSLGLAGILVVCLASFGYVLSSTPSATFYLSSGIYPGAPTYTVWKESTTYYAKDSNGFIGYSDSNASELISTTLAFGGTTYLANGVFLIDSSISMPSSSTLKGEGWNQTKIELMDDVNCVAIKNSDQTLGNENLKISDMTIDGNNAEQTSGSYVINFKLVTGFAIQNVLVENGHDHGIFLDTCYTGIVNNVICQYNSQHGINLYKSQKITISNSLFLNNSFNGILLEGLLGSLCSDNTVNNNVCDLNGYQGINLYIYAQYNTITGNICNHNGWYDSPPSTVGDGIMVENNCHYNTVNNNIAIGNDADGIQLYTSNYCTVIGNIVMNNGLRPAYGFDGIRLYNSSNNIINGNMAYDNQGSPTQDWGIKELGSSDWNIIIGNSCLTNQINGILQIGTNTKVNLCYNSTNWIA